MTYTIERRFRASPERLFRAFTRPEDLAAWVWGRDARDLRAEVDLVVGGEIRASVDARGGGSGADRAGLRGVFSEIRPPSRLVHTLHWDGPVGYTAPGLDPVDEVLIVEIDPDPAGSRLRYSHLGIPDDGVSAAEHERSVRVTLDVLDRPLAASP